MSLFIMELPFGASVNSTICAKKKKKNKKHKKCFDIDLYTLIKKKLKKILLGNNIWIHAICTLD
jgi:hypothetical protein